MLQFYTPPVNSTRFFLLLAIVPALVLLGTGCGGLNASHSVSPLNFLLPGLMKNDKPQEKTAPVATVPQSDPAQTVAQSL